MVKADWKYKGKPLDKIPPNIVGFIYRISFTTTSEFYIGRKLFYSTLTKPMSKKKIAASYSGKGRKRKKETVIKENKEWRNYTSSSNKVNQMLIDSTDNVNFEITHLCTSKTEMALLETYLILEQVMKQKKGLLNEWISVKSKLTM